VTRRVIVHSLDQAQAALRAAAELGVAVTLASAAGAGAYAGPLWFKALIDAARKAHPEAEFDAVLDCAEEAGSALAALRAGIARVGFSGPPDVAARLQAIAEALGAALETASGSDALDLVDARDPYEAARAFLAGESAAKSGRS
jgi:hypothetical protein